MSCVTWHLLLLGRAQPLCVHGKEDEVQMSAATLVVPSTPCIADGKGQHGNLVLTGVHVFLLPHTQAVTFNIYLLWEENY